MDTLLIFPYSILIQFQPTSYILIQSPEYAKIKITYNHNDHDLKTADKQNLIAQNNLIKNYVISGG